MSSPFELRLTRNAQKNPFGLRGLTEKDASELPALKQDPHQASRKKAGLPENINLHALRHTYATRLLELGEDLKVVQELLGHARIAVTADLYAHVSPKLKRDAVAKLNGTLTAKRKPSA